MGNPIKTIAAGVTFMSLAVFASDYVPVNVAWLKANNSSGNPTTWPGAGWWQLEGSDEPLDAEENSNQDYGVKDKVQFRPKIGTEVFPGRSLSLGPSNRSSSGNIIFRTSGDCDTTFANEGLFLNSGTMQSWNSGTQIVRGKVTVRSPDTSPVTIAFTDKGGKLVFRCPVESETGTGLYLHSLVASSTSMDQTNFVCRFMDDALAKYKGSIICGPVAYNYCNNVSWYKTDYNSKCKPPFHVTFQTDSGTMPGALKLYPNAIVAAETSTTDFSVGSLSSVSLNGYGTNYLSVALAADGSRCSVLRVTGTLDLRAPMAVRLSPDVAIDYFMATNAAAATRLPILKAPSGGVLDSARFFMERDDAYPYLPNYELEVAADEGDGLSTLWLVRRPVVWTLADDSGSTTSFTRKNWSDGGTAVPEKDYLGLHKIRTPAVTSTAVQTFPGHSLTLIGSGSSRMVTLNSAATRIDDLRVFYGEMDNLNRGSADYNFMANILNGSWMLEGRVRIASDGTLLLRCYNSKGFRVDSEISGGGTVKVSNEHQGNSGAVTSSSRRAYVGLFGLNTNFYGKVVLGSAATTTLEQRLGSNLAIRDARNLGAPLPKWTYDALTLNKCCGLHPLESLALEDETRGISVASTYAFSL